MEEPASALRSWVVRMGRPVRDLPSDSALRNLCSGQGRDIWEYVSRRVFPKESDWMGRLVQPKIRCHLQAERVCVLGQMFGQVQLPIAFSLGRKVKNVKGNLDWNRCMERAADASSEELDKKRLMDLVISLRADIQELDSTSDPEQQEMDERALAEARRRRQELQQRDALLKAYWLRAGSQRRRLKEHARKVGGQLQRLAQVRSAAQQEVCLLRTREGLRHRVWHRSGPEPRVLQDLRGACYSRSQFLKSLYDERNGSAESSRDGGSDRRSATYQQWLNQVEGAIASHPPKNILVALESLAAENEEELLELSSKVNVTRDMEELRFTYTSPHLQDVSEAPLVLRSVKSLLQEGWRDLEVQAVQKVGATRRQMELSCRLLVLGREFGVLLEERFGHNPELLNATREVFHLQLDLVERKRYRQELVEQAHLLTNSIVARNREIQSLQQKHSRILDFQRLVDTKQDLIRALVKGNSSAKGHLITTRAEILSFMGHELQQHKDVVRTLTEQLHNSISKEVGLFASVSLPCLDRRVLHGSQRVPVHMLSIHRMDSPIDNPQFFRRLKNILSFPLYKAPEHLIDEAAERKMERDSLRMLLDYQGEAVEALQKQQAAVSATDAQVLVEQVRQLDARCTEEAVPAVLRNLEQCEQALNFANTLRREVEDWWEQPAQFLVPWVKKEGRNVQDWIRRWNQLAQRSLGLSRDPKRQRPTPWDPS